MRCQHLFINVAVGQSSSKRVSTTAPFDRRTVSFLDGASPLTAMMRPSANVGLNDRSSGTAAAARGIRTIMEYGIDDGAAGSAALRNSPSHQNTTAINMPVPQKRSAS